MALGGPHDSVCFHAQQGIEKLLKGLLFSSISLPARSHDLEEIQRTLLKIADIPEGGVGFGRGHRFRSHGSL